MDSFKVYTPIDNSEYLERSYANAAAIHQTALRAKEAGKAWRATALSEREILCSKAVDYLMANQEAIAKEICWQMGRPVQYAAGEMKGLEERARHMIAIAKEALATLQCPPKEGYIRYIQRKPLGTCLVIAPWNYPYLTAVNAIIPALLAGNTVILKHARQTPLVAERFFAAFQHAGLADGVFQYLHLTHADTEKLIQSGAVQSVVFTGSVRAGEQIEQAAAGKFIPVTLELGGKDPAYIRADADLEYAVPAVIDGAFFNSGQSCCGIKRIYVHERIYHDFVNRAVQEAMRYRIGRPDNPETMIGPLVTSSAADHIRGQIEAALQQGASAHIDNAHPELDKPGSAYLTPQILTDVHHSMRIMKEESFGPVVGIMPVCDDAEAIRLMNDSDYGLTASVFTQDIDAGIALGEQLETGTFFINRCDYLDPALAWTGVKHSGRGCSLSALGFHALTRPMSFHIKTLSRTKQENV